MCSKTRGNLLHLSRQAFLVEGIDLEGAKRGAASPLAASREVAGAFTSLVRRRFGRDPRLVSEPAATVDQIARDLQSARQLSVPIPRVVLRSNDAAERRLLVLPGLHGTVHSMSRLEQFIPGNREVIGWEHGGVDERKEIPTNLTEMARAIVRGELQAREEGRSIPIELVGYCVGGTIAHEVASLLLQSGVDVARLTVIDAHPARVMREGGFGRKLRILGPIEAAKARLKGALEHRLVQIGIGQFKSLMSHDDHPVDLDLQLIRTGGELGFGPLDESTWSDLCRSVRVVRIPDVGHVELFRGRHEHRLEPILAA